MAVVFEDYAGNTIELESKCWAVHLRTKIVHLCFNNTEADFTEEYYKQWAWFLHKEEADRFVKEGEEAFIGIEF
jgi:hypothetical protein